MKKFKRSARLKTAYGLAMAAAREIRKEPAAYYQEDWAHTQEVGSLPEYCDTAFCRGGMMVFLADGVVSTRYSQLNEFGQSIYFDFSARAEKLMGLMDKDKDTYSPFERDLNALFSGGALELETRRLSISRSDSDYSELGARGVEVFAEKHKARLKATKLPRPLRTNSKRQAVLSPKQLKQENERARIRNSH